MGLKRNFFLQSGKVFLLLMLCLTTCFWMAADVCAGDYTIDRYVVDEADLLEPEEESELEALCEELKSHYGIAAPIVTVQDFGGGDIKDWERQIFTSAGWGSDTEGNGVILAVSMAERDWGIETFGSCQDALNQYGREKIGEEIVPYLSDGEYAEAFRSYLEYIDIFMEQAETGTPYSQENHYREPVSIGLIVLCAFIFSLLVSLVIVLAWKRSMNTRIRQDGADVYLKRDTFHLTKQQDLFLYHTVSRTKREEEHDNVSMSSSDSGTSGKF